MHIHVHANRLELIAFFVLYNSFNFIFGFYFWILFLILFLVFLRKPKYNKKKEGNEKVYLHIYYQDYPKD